MIEENRRSCGSLTADVLESELPAINAAVYESYFAEYPDSQARSFPREAIERWGADEVRMILDVLRGSEPTVRVHSFYAGDMVLGGDSIVSPLFNFVETQLFIARIMAPFIWKHAAEYPMEYPLMVSELENAVFAIVSTNMKAFADSQLTPGSLSRTWSSKPQPRPAAWAAPSPLDPIESLTRRENEIARMASEGRTIGEMAHDLNIAQNTVKNHLKSIYNKLGVSNRAELTRRLLSEK